MYEDNSKYRMLLEQLNGPSAITSNIIRHARPDPDEPHPHSASLTLHWLTSQKTEHSTSDR